MNFIYLIFLFFLMMNACTNPNEHSLEIQGHRGARGLAPENSIPSFKKALDHGVHTLELDVVISKDHKVVISHEPYMSAAICSDADGNNIDPKKEKEYNLYEMEYEQIKKFDCGSRGNVNFPEQKKEPVYKPLLSEMIEEIELYVDSNNLPKPNYNIEVKINPETDGTYHPAPAEFLDLVYEVIEDKIAPERINIQSFDKRVLQYWKKNYPEYRLAFLVEEALSPQELEETLGFLPEIYSPYYKILSEDIVQQYHDLKVKVIPWTINEVDDMARVKDWNVDGIITDYPDRAMKEF